MARPPLLQRRAWPVLKKGTGDFLRDELATIEQHAHALVFSSHNGAKYLFDAATATLHPWPWGIGSSALDGLYDTPDERLPTYLHDFGAPRELARYVLLWREKAGAFGHPNRPSNRCSPMSCGGAGAEGEASCGLWSEGRPKQPPPLRTALPTIFGNLILVVTDSCNLRCRYCLLGAGSGFKPLRSEHMSEEVAKRAVDHYIALNDTPAFRAMHNRKINIAFFGGEPLLRGCLIRQVVDYSKALEKPGCGYWIDYSLTSNLTHLPDDLAAFLVERDVGIQVSLDGPQHVHDSCRVDAGGNGSFCTVMRNLEKLRKLDAAYFARRVTCVVTVNGHSDLLAIHEFLESGNPVIPPVGFVGLIRDLERSEFHRRSPYDVARFWQQYCELMEEYLRRLQSGIPVVRGQFLYRLFEEGLSVLDGRTMQHGTPARSSYTGTCQPGRRLAVSTDGHFHICERINEGFPLGDVQSGLDLQKCAELLRRYYQSLPDCDRCWARSACGTCMAVNCSDGGFEFGARCDHFRVELAHRLRLLCTVRELRPDSLSTGDPLIDRMSTLEIPA